MKNKFISPGLLSLGTIKWSFNIWPDENFNFTYTKKDIVKRITKKNK